MRQLFIAVLERDAEEIITLLLSRGALISHWERQSVLRASSQFKVQFQNQGRQFYSFCYGYKEDDLIDRNAKFISLELSGIRKFEHGSQVLYLSELHARGPISFPEELKDEWAFLRRWLRKNFLVKTTDFNFKQRNWTIHVGRQAQAWLSEATNHYIHDLAPYPAEPVLSGPFLPGAITNFGPMARPTN